MSLVCDYESFDNGTLCHNLVTVTRRRGSRYCEEHCSNSASCSSFLIAQGNQEEIKCWISAKELPMGSSNVLLGEATGSCHVKIQDSCRITSTRGLEKCQGACVLDLLLVIPGLIIYAIVGFLLFCLLCCLPCICIEMCRPATTRLELALATTRPKANAEGYTSTELAGADRTDEHVNGDDLEVGTGIAEVEMVSFPGKEKGEEVSISPPEALIIPDIQESPIDGKHFESSIRQSMKSP